VLRQSCGGGLGSRCSLPRPHLTSGSWLRPVWAGAGRPCKGRSRGKRARFTAQAGGQGSRSLVEGTERSCSSLKALLGGLGRTAGGSARRVRSGRGARERCLL
jgi:hypothetical protein